VTDDVSTIRTGGVRVPALGFGTFELDPEEVERTVPVALDVGYRHIDTAQAYRNEAAVGDAIAGSPVDRDDVFVTTKVWRDRAAPEDVESSTAASLRELDMDHVDLLLLHWPAEDIAPLEATLEAMTAARDRGMTEHIGVSNFPSAELARAFELAPIVTDQVEHHPYLAVDPIERVLADNGGFLTAYCPIAKGKVAEDATLDEIGEEHGVGPVQVTLRWLLQRGVAALPRTSKPERVAENARVHDFALTDDEMERIAGLAVGERLIDPPFGPEWDAG
jgi:diketogulonate reductase-like aldo/keto reductase